jgi:hypothetical protein
MTLRLCYVARIRRGNAIMTLSITTGSLGSKGLTETVVHFFAVTVTTRTIVYAYAFGATPGAQRA